MSAGLSPVVAGGGSWCRASSAQLGTSRAAVPGGRWSHLPAAARREEVPAQAVRAQLDYLRATYGCAIVLEAHTPHASNGGNRPERPYGASLWLRWPEFGLFLAESSALRHWRGARDERDWPAVLQRGGEWPWTAVTRSRDVHWARIVEVCEQDDGGRPSLGDLATRLGVPKSAVQRAVNEHRDQWEAMARATSLKPRRTGRPAETG